MAVKVSVTVSQMHFDDFKWRSKTSGKIAANIQNISILLIGRRIMTCRSALVLLQIQIKLTFTSTTVSVHLYLFFFMFLLPSRDWMNSDWDAVLSQ